MDEPIDLTDAPDEGSEYTDIDELRTQIANYYVSDQIVDAFKDLGGIPEESHGEILGIGFIDIVDYSRLAHLLSAREDQDVLNGLYTAFHLVLRMHGGYLNKIEGDSLMFHFGGITDPRVRHMNDQEQLYDISRRLFQASVQMQRFCRFFNNVDDHFFSEVLQRTQEKSHQPSEADLELLNRAFMIMKALRENLPLIGRSIDAEFQIQIRIGASIGIGTERNTSEFVRNLVKEMLPESDQTNEHAIAAFIRKHSVIGGNFGPAGAKQWDVLGTPVIEAKRMESTAPVGGLRITALMHRLLELNREVTLYHDRFRREAAALGSRFRRITPDELFKRSTVTLSEKRNEQFSTYSVQVNPGLPEFVAAQVEKFIDMGIEGADEVIRLLQYYRGVSFVIDAVEETFARRNRIALRKDYMLRTMYPSQWDRIVAECGDDPATITETVNREFSLYDLLARLGRFQDLVKSRPVSRQINDEEAVEKNAYEEDSFGSYDRYIERRDASIRRKYSQDRIRMVQRAYFFNVVMPLVFESIRGSILEYQQTADETVEELEEID